MAAMQLAAFIRLTCFISVICHPVFVQSNADFTDPPAIFRPKFRYWLPDASVSPDAVAKDIDAAREAGAGGLEIVPFYLYGRGEESFTRDQADPVPHLSDWSKYGFGTLAYIDLLKSTLQAAKEADIRLDHAIGANQGQGIPSEISTPGLAVQLLMGVGTVSSDGIFNAHVPPAQQPSTQLQSGLGFMHPLEWFDTPNLTAVIAYQVEGGTADGQVHLNETSFVDLSQLVTSNKTLQWSSPDSTQTWKIFSFWEAYTNQRSCDGGPNATTFLGNGSWTVDHFSKKGASRVTDFWDQHILSNSEVADLLRDVGKYAWEDSMEILATLYWTPGFLDRFKDTHGYDLLPYLPLLFSMSNSWNGILQVYNETFAFGKYQRDGDSVYQLDYRKVLNDGYQEYLQHLQNWTHSIGLQFSTQPAYNLPLQALSDIPLTDAPEGESLGFSELSDVYRQFLGPAHLSDKKIISTEIGAIQTPPYWLTVPNLLQKIKRSFAGGFTMNVIHGFPTLTPYSNTTWPGYTPFIYEFTDMWNPIQPAWQHLKDSLDFVGRNQWVLQQGQPKVDLAFYLYAAPWPAVTRYTSDNLRNRGYTYDYLGPDNLVSPDAFVEDNMLGIPKFTAVIFNNQTVASIEAVEALIGFASQGLKLVFVGPPPNQSYPADAATQSEFDSAMTRLLSGPNIYRTNTTDQLFSLLENIDINPRVNLNCTAGSFYTTWRSTEDVDYVYFFNDQNEPSHCTATIETTGTIPYIYGAWSGTQSPYLQYVSTATHISVPTSLKSNETLIIALHRNATQPACTIPQFNPDIRSVESSGEKLQAIVTSSPYDMTTSTNKTVQFNDTLPAHTNLTTWELTIEDYHSAPDRFAIENEITNRTFSNVSLVPWNQISSSLEPVSGIGHYTIHFEPPSNADFSKLVGFLTLPLIQHTARVFLDGNWLGPIDPVNPVIPLKDLQGGKVHELRVEVSTTLFNRVKAEADLVWMVGQVASKITDKYGTLPYEEYGLVGSVWIDWGYRVDVEC